MATDSLPFSSFHQRTRLPSSTQTYRVPSLTRSLLLLARELRSPPRFGVSVLVLVLDLVLDPISTVIHRTDKGESTSWRVSASSTNLRSGRWLMTRRLGEKS